MVGSSEQGVVAPTLAADRLAFVFGNGAPTVVAPALTDAVSPERPWDGVALLPATWQPLQVFVSPGINCIQLACRAPMRLAFLSSTSTVNGTLAGNWTFTEPSGSTGA